MQSAPEAGVEANTKYFIASARKGEVQNKSIGTNYANTQPISLGINLDNNFTSPVNSLNSQHLVTDA